MIVYPRQEDEVRALRHAARAYLERLIDAAKGKRIRIHPKTPFEEWLRSINFNPHRAGYLSDEVLQLLKEAWDVSRERALKE